MGESESDTGKLSARVAVTVQRDTVDLPLGANEVAGGVFSQ